MRATIETDKPINAPPYAAVGGRVSLLHVVVVSLSLVMTLGAYYFSKSQINTRSEGRFQAATDQAVALLEERMEKYEDALWAGVAAIDAKGGEISKQEWRLFAESLRLPEKYPGINGIGVIHFVDENEMEPYLQRRKAEAPEFKVFPAHDQDLRMPISFIEPESINAAAVGLDVAHESNRRTAALASRDTATAQITGPIVLVQDESSTPGFLFYAPFYEGGRASTEADRRERAKGAVYAPFVVAELMEGLLAKDLRDIRFSIRDNGEVIYNELGEEESVTDPDPMYQTTRQVVLNGRVWELDLETTLKFREVNTYAQPYVILLGGLVIEALIISLLVLMARANNKAVKFADKVTGELVLEKDKLTKTNEELETFVYIMSHDMKTPIRGIGSLTEMLQEDLSTYLNSSDANPDVTRNLERINERVSQLEDLGNGVLELTGIGQYEVPNEPLLLEETINSIGLDLGISPKNVTLSGDVSQISCDPFHFRRILENLIGNAVKHHHSLSNLRLSIEVTHAGDRALISVADNGPGIDQKFHKRIFEIFQTLNADGAPKSTGVGLAIVRKAVERHGGKINIDSEIGLGTKFVFDWPCPGNAIFDEVGSKAA